ncbi:DUF2188 domain-containing protein [Psychrobacter vallis]|uniref:DUF2188 domain-containing protein n=1 Tax=Psychrobacter vallis TaxID=248451 RepID=UPI001917BC69|nr:DUF2188 domain-containing protein [Psychrobacter vallis]
MPRKTHHVVPNAEGGWDVKGGGSKRAIKHHERKTDAINQARGISINQKSELVIHNKDRKISNADSHGNDPYPPKDKR